ncbi:hypothetical protein PRIPAC_79082 [Pristionchus pacificus]|nr:hypothetical protein PRIPAC_79082 [Pristionchus pacificus]
MPLPHIDSVPIVDYFKNLFQYEVEFADDDKSYRCMRGAFHVINVSKCLIVLEMIVFFLATMTLLPWCLLWFLPHLLLILVTLYALKRERPRFMWPIIIFAATQLFIWCLVSAFSFLLAIISTDTFLGLFGQGHHDDLFLKIFVVIIVKSLILILAAFLFWRFTVFRTTRIYLEKKMDGEAAPSTEEPTPLEKLMTPV